MPWAIRLVADIFRVVPKKVRADLIKMAQVTPVVALMVVTVNFLGITLRR